MSEGPFQTRTMTWITGVAAVSFAIALILAIFGPDLGPPPQASNATAFSVSALGHAALVDALERLDVPLVVSRHGSARKARANGVLVLAEPSQFSRRMPDGTSRIAHLIEESAFTLLVLPKRRGVPRADKPEWVSDTNLLSVNAVESLLAEVGIGASIRRVEGETVSPIQSRIGARPTFEPGAVVQVIEGPALWPLVTTNGGGTLLARSERHQGLYILADPDPLSNADVHRGENALFFLRVLNNVRDGYESVVFDETIHGHESTPSIWREIFAFPLVLVPIHLLLLLVIVLWAGTGRFGTPRAPEPPLEPGISSLVDRTAELARYGGSSLQALPRYLDVALQDARRDLDAPPTLKDEALDAWLDRVGENRRVPDRVAALRDAVDQSRGHPHAVLHTAARIHRWKTEILHGPQ